jgi:hypothetical protein
MKRLMTLTSAVLLCLGSNAFAQQKQQISFKIPNENSKFTISQSLDIGDVPNHTVRLFETHNTVPNNAANINGLKIVDIISRGVGETTDGHGGSSSSYVIFVADGDKLFSRNNVIVQRVSRNLIAIWSGHITGGTGKLANLQGTMRVSNDFDPSPGGTPSNTQFDIEYSIGK